MGAEYSGGMRKQMARGALSRGPVWTPSLRVVFLLLAFLVSLAAGCAPSQDLAAASALPAEPVSTDTPAPTAPPPTETRLPTVPAAATSVGLHSSLPTASATPTPLPTRTPAPPPSPTAISTPDLAASPAPVPAAVSAKEIVHILLIGADTGSYAPDQNTDSLIVASINRSTKQVTLLSIPRDLWVYIPTVGYSRINTAHRYGTRLKYPGGGPALLMRTIQENIGIGVDHWVRVDYQGFAAAVDKLGGVDLLVPCETNLRYRPTDSGVDEEMTLEPGYHHMDGATALRYVRTRRGESDFDRARRQQQFLKAVWDQFKDANKLTAIPGLWSAMSGNFATDLGLGDVLSLAPVVLDLKRENIRSRYIGRSQTQDWTTPDGWEVLLPIPERVQQVVAALDAPPSDGESAVASEAARIQVNNGTTRPYLAEIGADQLRWSGFTVAGTGTAARTDYKNTQIIVYRDKPDTLARLIELLKVKPESVALRPDPAQPVDLQVILGGSYDPCP